MPANEARLPRGVGLAWAISAVFCAGRSPNFGASAITAPGASRPCSHGLRLATLPDLLGNQGPGTDDNRDINHFAFGYASALARRQRFLVGSDHTRGAVDFLGRRRESLVQDGDGA